MDVTQDTTKVQTSEAACHAAVESLDRLREQLGLSIPELASLAGLDRTYLWRVLAGRRRPSPEVLGACLVALGTAIKGAAA